MSNGKIEVVYAKQALLKPAVNLRYLQQITEAVARCVTALGQTEGLCIPSPASCLSLSPSCPVCARVNTHIIAPYEIQLE